MKWQTNAVIIPRSVIHSITPTLAWDGVGQDYRYNLARDGHANKHRTYSATGDCDPVYGGCRRGLPYYSIYYQKVAQSLWIFATVTGSPAV